MGFATKWKTKILCAKEWSKRHIFLSHFFIFHHKQKRMLKCLRNGFWIVIVQKILKKCLSHSGKMHFSVSGHVTLGVVWWRHELDYICPLWVLSKFGPMEAYRCRVIANWFFPSNGIKRYFNGPLISLGITYENCGLPAGWLMDFIMTLTWALDGYACWCIKNRVLTSLRVFHLNLLQLVYIL